MEPASKNSAKNGKYHFQKRLGGGKFADVYLYFDNESESHVAIKKLKSSKSQLDAKILELLKSEINVLKSIRNENVVRLYDVFIENGYYHLVLEYCNEGDLENYIQKKPKKSIPEPEALGFLKQFLNGFKALHDLKVMHRDFKLENILLHDGVTKIADFGFCKQTDITQTCAGTGFYMAPEMMDFDLYTNKVDIWSLGVSLYRMLFGVFPFRPEEETKTALRSKIRENIIDFNYGGRKISKEMQLLISGMLTEDPEKRIDWKNIYGHPLLNERENKLGALSGSACEILNKKEIEKEKQKAQFENNKLDYSTKKSFNNKESEKSLKAYADDEPSTIEEEYSKVQIQNSVEFKKKSEIVEKKKKDGNMPEEKKNGLNDISELVKQKTDALQLLERKYLHQRNLITIFAKILNDGLILGENQDATFTYFLILKKICILSENFAQILTEEKNVFQEQKFFSAFINSDFYRNLLQVFLANNETYHCYFYDYLIQAQGRKYTDFYNTVLPEMNDDFQNEENVDNLLLKAICEYLEHYIKNQNLLKAQAVYLNEVADCVNFKEIFKFDPSKEEGFDFEGYQKRYQEQNEEKLMKKFIKKYQILSAKGKKN